MVDGVCGLVVAQVGDGEVERLDGLDHLGDDPAVDRELSLGRLDRRRRTDAVALREAGGVPQLGREIAIAFDPLLIELDVAPLAFHRSQGEAQRIGAIFIDQAERIDGVALRLGHFRTVRCTDQPVQIEGPERHLTHEVNALHDHPGIPEEQYVEARDQHIVRIMAVQERLAATSRIALQRRIGPAERPERPQRRREPGVEHIAVAGDLPVAGQRLRPRLVLGDINLAFLVIPGGNLVPPPQLARDAPGLDVLEPVIIGLGPALRHHLDRARAHRLDRGLRQRLGIDIPLVGQPGLDHHARAVAIGRLDDSILDLLEQAGGVDRFDHLLARLEAVEAEIIFRDQTIRSLDQLRLAIEHVEHLAGLETRALADLEIVEVMPRRDLHRARTELGIGMLIGNDRDQPAGDRQLHHLADPRPVTIILGVHCDRHVGEHRLRPRRRDRDRP